ncbi:unnamed protein product [Cercospora beticola]|nr:unnamed protein product [Cercospora beticola]
MGTDGRQAHALVSSGVWVYNTECSGFVPQRPQQAGTAVHGRNGFTSIRQSYIESHSSLPGWPGSTLGSTQYDVQQIVLLGYMRVALHRRFWPPQTRTAQGSYLGA